MSDQRREFNDQRYLHFVTFSVHRRRRLLDLIDRLSAICQVKTCSGPLRVEFQLSAMILLRGNMMVRAIFVIVSTVLSLGALSPPVIAGIIVAGNFLDSGANRIEAQFARLIRILL